MVDEIPENSRWKYQSERTYKIPATRELLWCLNLGDVQA
jgi:hypothetical protein